MYVTVVHDGFFGVCRRMPHATRQRKHMHTKVTWKIYSKFVQIRINRQTAAHRRTNINTAMFKNLRSTAMLAR